MKKLSSNQELYEYLLRMIAELRTGGSVELADTIAFAAKQASSMSTEFLGESRIALRQVLNEENGVLSKEARAEMSEVIKQLDQALDQRPSGAP